jgi:ketosteroid isomerase-like protein
VSHQREAGVAGELEAVARETFAALDANDGGGVLDTGAEDMQGVDEISRRWLRAIDDVGDYVRQLTKMVDSTITDVHETVVGDMGMVTCWLEQDYVMEGARQHVSAPTTMCFRRDDGAWKIVLFHSVASVADTVYELGQAQNARRGRPKVESPMPAR